MSSTKPLGTSPDALDTSRFDAGVTNVRRHVARGTIVNSAFQIGLSLLGLVQLLVVAIFVTRSDVGLWAVILTSLVTLAWLKQIGVQSKYVQQSEADQQAAFQKAFTVELFVSLAFFALVCLLLPAYALIYGLPKMIVPGIVAALSVPLTAFEAPAWIPYRRLDYVRNRTLTAVNPVVTTVVTIALAAAGFDYWCFVIGIVAGSAGGAIVCVVTSAYPLRLRIDRATLRSYASFSVPLFFTGVSALIVIQGGLIVAKSQVGLAGVGAIGLAVGFAAFAERVDSIVSQTIYPAVCAAASMPKLLFEAFVKSNRLALMWAMPFGVGLALFSGDLVHFILGARWEPAIGLMAATGVIVAFGQIAFNWTIFMQAVDNTRPILRVALFELATFALAWVPAMIAWGLTGWAAGLGALTLTQVAARGYYMGRLLGFKVLNQLVRAVTPIIPPTTVILLLRVVSTGQRSPLRAIAEAALFGALAILCTSLFERDLVREVIGYLRRRRPSTGTAVAGTMPGTAGERI
jgi:O-antigen/teichoic acid export membrane protein